MGTLTIRASMALGFEHPGERRALEIRDSAPGSEYSGDTAHKMRNYFSF
jgi:hypothetical protein